MTERLDIPQATLERTREVIDAVGAGAVARDAIEQRTGIARRQIGYGIVSAKALELMTEPRRNALELTDLGRELMQAPVGSIREAELFRRAISESAVMTQVAPGLLEPTAPSRELLSERIVQLGGLSPATAEHRTGMLLRWRRQLLDPSGGAVRRLANTTGRWRRLRVRNFRSIGQLSIDLAPLTFIVGANGSGKSNLMDALAFAAELSFDPPAAVGRRGGWRNIRRLGVDEPSSEVVVDVRAAATRHALQDEYLRYRFCLSSADDQVWRIDHEIVERVQRGDVQVRLARDADGAVQQLGGETEEERLDTRASLMTIAEDLADFGHLVPLRGVWRPQPDPRAMRAPCAFEEHARLAADGGNVASAVRRLSSSRSFPTLLEAMRNVAPGLDRLDVVERDSHESLVVRQMLSRGAAVELTAGSLSDGALRALALLVGAQQLQSDELLIVEHPEQSLDPQALAVVLEGLEAASRRAGVVIATHSDALVALAKDAHVLTCSRRDGVTMVEVARGRSGSEDAGS